MDPLCGVVDSRLAAAGGAGMLGVSVDIGTTWSRAIGASICGGGGARIGALGLAVVNEKEGTVGFEGKRPLELRCELNDVAISCLGVSCLVRWVRLSFSSSWRSLQTSLFASSASRIASSRSLRM